MILTHHPRFKAAQQNPIAPIRHQDKPMKRRSFLLALSECMVANRRPARPEMRATKQDAGAAQANTGSNSLNSCPF